MEMNAGPARWQDLPPAHTGLTRASTDGLLCCRHALGADSEPEVTG
jgi:hypothetical protein